MYYIFLTTLTEHKYNLVSARLMVTTWAGDGVFKYAIYSHLFFSAN